MRVLLRRALVSALQPGDAAFIAWTVAVAAALTILATVQTGAGFAHHGHEVPWLGILLARTVNCFSYALFMPLLWLLARRRPIRPSTLGASLALYLGVSLIVALAKEAIFVAIGNLFRPGVFVLSEILAEDYLDEVLTVWALIAAAHALALHQQVAEQTPATSGADGGEGHLTFFADGVFHRVRLGDIERAEAQGNYVELSTGSGRKLIRETMNRLQARVGVAFVRVHRSYIVRADKVIRIEPRAHSEYWLVLASGARIPTSRRYKDEVRERLMTDGRSENSTS